MNIGKETEQVEFKTSLAEQKKGFESIASILNKHQSGVLYFGVIDNGDVKGLQVGKDTLNHLSRDIELYINPFLSHSIKELKTTEGLSFIEITFNGTNTPYSAYGRYFLRFADIDKPMDQQMLAEYFEMKKTSYINWENANSNCSIDDIDDSTINEYIRRGNECGRIKFTHSDKVKDLKRLGLLYNDILLNNAGNVLFSSKKPLKLKVATFATERRATIIDMNIFSGNVYECIEEGMGYISKHIDWKVVFDGSSRSKEVPEIPMEAIREIVVNAFAHGSYESKATEFEISIYKDRVVIYSPGHFPKPYTPEEFARSGREPIPLNNKICDILYNDETIEKHSTGFERAFAYCDKEKIKYEYEDTGLGFRFTFYRKNVHGHVQVTLNKRDQEILDIIKECPSSTIKELALKLNVTEKTIFRSIKKLKELNKLIRVGSDKNGYWKAI